MTIIGQTFGHYRITGLLGSGGMGEVYRATDPELHREVALKILPETLATDPLLMARFQREGQMLASLSHSNIAAVHGLAHSGDRQAIVMELVDGEDLAARLRRGPVPSGEAIRIALAIAAALEYAHEHGVIHRDLKPANVKVRSDGEVKVLDFGLAKAFDSSAPAGSTAIEQSPTLTVASTRAGIILGTAAYMSPEQASGQAVDKRCDIWSLGVLLFEMLSGSRLFNGETVSHTLADVLRGDVDWRRLPADTSPAIRRLLERCLERDRKRRLRDIGEARIVLQEHLAEADSSGSRQRTAAVAASPAVARKGSWPMWAIGAAVLIALGLGVAAMVRRNQPPAAPTLRVDVKLSTGHLYMQLGASVVLSPDGTRVAYVDGGEQARRLYVRPSDQLEGTVLATGGSESDAPYHPFFAPDGSWVGYVTAGELKKVPVSGGTPLTLTKVSRSRGADWGPDGRIVFAASVDTGLSLIAATGGTPQPLTTLDKEKKEATHRWPQFLPGGAAVVFTAHTQSDNFDTASIEVVKVATGERKTLVAGGTFGRFVPSGHVVYVNKGTLFAVPFDSKRLEVTGPAAPVIQTLTASNEEGGAQLSFSDTGLVAAHLPWVCDHRRQTSHRQRRHHRPLVSPSRLQHDGSRPAQLFGLPMTDSGDAHAIVHPEWTVGSIELSPTGCVNARNASNDKIQGSIDRGV